MVGDTQGAPLVIFGLDTGDFDAIKQWAQEGYLPTIASIMQRGLYGRTIGPEMICEYGIGLTLYSGISRTQHDYYYFRQLQPGTYDLQSIHPSDVDALPFWSHLHGRDKKVLIVDVPDIEVVPRLPGLQLANWATHHGSFGPSSAEPVTLLDDARRVFGPKMTIPPNPNSSLREDRRIYRRLLERIEKKGALCQDLLSRDRFDLVVLSFSESDPASHQFWQYRPQAAGNGAAATQNELSHGIRDVYQAIDHQMGLLLAQLPRDVNVFLVSLYGIQDEYPTTTLIESFCRQLGYQASLPSSFRPLSLARRMVPHAWRTTLSRHLPQAVQERLVVERFYHGTDWQKTTAFAIPSLFTSFVRVNLKGREPEGIVQPGAEYEAILNQLEDDLKQLVDPHTGKPAVKQVSRTVELFRCGPPVSLPDLFVEWQPGPRLVDRVVHPRAVLVQQKPQYCPSSQEKLSGFYAAAGPSVRTRGGIGDVELLDLAPTFLSLMDEPVAERMGGQAMEAIVHG